MVNNCCIPSCPKPKNITCYKVPQKPSKREEWLSSINSKSKLPKIAFTNQEITVCSLHFKQSDYTYLFCDDQTSKRDISPNAVPSIFPWTSDWNSNFAAEMEIADLYSNNNIMTIIPCSELPEGEAIELGNMESLGISDAIVEEPSLTHEESPQKINCSEVRTFKRESTIANLNMDAISLKGFSKKVTHNDCKLVLPPLNFNYSCADCEFKTANIVELKNHKSQKHPSNQIITQVNETCSTVQNTSVDPNQQSEEEISFLCNVPRFYDRQKRCMYYLCVKCEFKSPFLDRLNRHEKTEHASVNCFRKSSTNVSQTNQEKNDPINNAPHTKQSPRKNYVSMLEQSELRKIRKNGRCLYVCPSCSFKAHDKKRVFAHFRSTHSSPASSAEATTSGADGKTGRYYCHLCDFSTLKSCARQSHERQHSSNARYRCLKCNYAVGSQQKLALHSRYHHKKSSQIEQNDSGIQENNSVTPETESNAADIEIKRTTQSYSSSTEELSPPDETKTVIPGVSKLKEKTHIFKCSSCNFCTRDRRAVTRHIRNNSFDESHINAKWISISPPKKHSQILENHMSDTGSSPISKPKKKRIGAMVIGSESSEIIEDTSSESGESSDGSNDWVPTESAADTDEEYSSSASFVVESSSSSSDDESAVSSMRFVDSSSSESKSKSSGSSISEEKGKRKRRSTKSNGKVKRTRRSTTEDPRYPTRRSRMSVNEESGAAFNSETSESTQGESNAIPESVAGFNSEASESTQGESNAIPESVAEIIGLQLQLNHVPRFYLIDEAQRKYRNIKDSVLETENEIHKLQEELQSMKEADIVRRSELQVLMEMEARLRTQKAKLNNQKIEAELELRLHQCEELKLNLALSEAENQDEICENNLKERKALVAQSQLKVEEYTRKISSLEVQKNSLEKEINDAKDSRSSAAQLIEINRSNIAKNESKLRSLQQELEKSRLHVENVIKGEKKRIAECASSWQSELRKSYLERLSNIRQKEKEMLSALNHYAESVSTMEPTEDHAAV